MQRREEKKKLRLQALRAQENETCACVPCGSSSSSTQAMSLVHDVRERCVASHNSEAVLADAAQRSARDALRFCVIVIVTVGATTLRTVSPGIPQQHVNLVLLIHLGTLDTGNCGVRGHGTHELGTVPKLPLDLR